MRLHGEDLTIQEGTDLGFAQKRKPKFKKDPKKIQLRGDRSTPSRPTRSCPTARPIINKKKKDL
ncbi:MAG: hypothetical protein ACFCAD_05935 [Pleurocapsa sp.]